MIESLYPTAPSACLFMDKNSHVKRDAEKKREQRCCRVTCKRIIFLLTKIFIKQDMINKAMSHNLHIDIVTLISNILLFNIKLLVLLSHNASKSLVNFINFLQNFDVHIIKKYLTLK